MCAARAVLEHQEFLGILGRKLHGHRRTHDADEPGIAVARRDPLGGKQHWKFLSISNRLASENGVVPGFAGNCSPLLVRALSHDIGKQGAHVLGLPTQPQRQVDHVHAQIAHAAVFAIHGDQSLPVNRLLGIKIAAVPEPGFDFDDPADASVPHPLPDAIRSGTKGKL